MHGTPAMAHPLTLAVQESAARLGAGSQVVLCPPAILLPLVAGWLASATPRLSMGGQDCHIQPEGAYTGDISAVMLKNAGCTHVIVGHSERRLHHHETNADVRNKAKAAIKSGLIPIICIGETNEDRAGGKAEAVIGEQVRDCLPEEAVEGNFVLAYEPVWAIGSGKTPSGADIGDMHAHILSVASSRLGLDSKAVSVLYGGSVKAENAREIMSIQGVSGVLVGGASLKAEEFCNIIAAVTPA